jgi:FAD synthetase
MEKAKIIEKKGKKFVLTEKGRNLLKIVFTAGTFDILHPGHIRTLEKAKKFGDILVVVVARDSNVRKAKNKLPILPEDERVELVASLKPVDIALIGNLKNKLQPIEMINPDYVVLGPNQNVSVEKLRKELNKRNLYPKIVRIQEYITGEIHSSSKAISKVIEFYKKGLIRIQQ